MLYSLLLNLFERVVNLTLAPLGSRRRTIVRADLSERLTPVQRIETDHGPLSFYGPSSLAVWRADTLLTKEPETIEWIDSFAPGELLWDVGANVGLYSLYAAARGTRVVAFEPSAWNYFVLNRNIEINRMADRVSAMPVAVSDVSGVGFLVTPTTDPGSALSEFRASESPSPWSGHLAHGAIGFSLDDYLERFGTNVPNHLKVDVDGLESAIISGASRLLCEPRLRSVSIEIDAAQEDAVSVISDALTSVGFRLEWRRHGPEFETGPFSSTYNYLFVRQPGTSSEAAPQ